MMICYHNQNTFMFSKVNVQRDYSSNPCTPDIYQENQLGAVRDPVTELALFVAACTL